MKGEASSSGICVRLVVVAIVWNASFIAGRVASTAEVAMFGCVLSWAAYTLLGKRLLGEGVSVLAATTYAALAGTATLVPAVAITLGVLLLGERLTPPMVIGAALVVSGVFIINRTPTTSTAGHHACSHTG